MIKKQASIIFFGKLFTQLTNLIIMLLIARTLGSVNYGLLSLGSTIMIMTYTIFNFGIETAIAYYVPHHSDNKIMTKKLLDTVIIIRLITGFIGSIILYYFANKIELLYNIKGLEFIIKIFAIGFTGYSIAYLSPSIFQAFKKFKLLSINDIINSIIKLLLILFSLNYGLRLITINFNISLLINGLLSLIIILIKIRPRIKTNGLEVKRIFNYSLIVYAGAISVFIINYIGNLLVGSSPSNVSFLTIGNKIGMLVILPASSIGMALMPNISGINNKRLINKRFSKAVNYSLIITAFLSLLIIVSSNWLITWLLGDSYSGSELIINLLMIGYLINGLIIPLTILFNGINKPLIVTKSLILQGVIMLISSLLLVPYIGGIGAAISFIISNISLLIILLINSYRIGYKINFSYLLRLLIVLLLSYYSSLISKGVLSAIIYALTFFLLSNIFKLISKNI